GRVGRGLAEQCAGKADLEHDQKRHQEEQAQPQHRDADHEKSATMGAKFLPNAAEPAEQVAYYLIPETADTLGTRRAHAGSTTADAASQDRYRVSSQS